MITTRHTKFKQFLNENEKITIAQLDTFSQRIIEKLNMVYEHTATTLDHVTELKTKTRIAQAVGKTIDHAQKKQENLQEVVGSMFSGVMQAMGAAPQPPVPPATPHPKPTKIKKADQLQQQSDLGARQKTWLNTAVKELLTRIAGSPISLFDALPENTHIFSEECTTCQKKREKRENNASPSPTKIRLQKDSEEGKHQNISRNCMSCAKEHNIPILIRQGKEYFLYGCDGKSTDKEGKKNWTVTTMSREQNEVLNRMSLPFDQDELGRFHPLFTAHLISQLKNGHAQIGCGAYSEQDIQFFISDLRKQIDLNRNRVLIQNKLSSQVICKSSQKENFLNYVLTIAERLAIQYLYVRKIMNMKASRETLDLSPRGFSTFDIPENDFPQSWDPANNLNEYIANQDLDAKFKECIVALPDSLETEDRAFTAFNLIKSRISRNMALQQQDFQKRLNIKYPYTSKHIEEKQADIEALIKQVEAAQIGLTELKESLLLHYQNQEKIPDLPVRDFPTEFVTQCKLTDDLYVEGLRELYNGLNLEVGVSGELRQEKLALNKAFLTINGEYTKTIQQLQEKLELWRDLLIEAKMREGYVQRQQEYLNSSDQSYPNYFEAKCQQYAVIFEIIDRVNMLRSQAESLFCELNEAGQLSREEKEQWDATKKHKYPKWNSDYKQYHFALENMCMVLQSSYDNFSAKRERLKKQLEENEKEMQRRRIVLHEKTEALETRCAVLGALWHKLMVELPTCQTIIFPEHNRSTIQPIELKLCGDYYTDARWNEWTQKKQMLVAQKSGNVSEINQKIQSIESMISEINAEIKEAGGESQRLHSSTKLNRITQLTKQFEQIKTADGFSKEYDFSRLKSNSIESVKNELTTLSPLSSLHSLTATLLSPLRSPIKRSKEPSTQSGIETVEPNDVITGSASSSGSLEMMPTIQQSPPVPSTAPVTVQENSSFAENNPTLSFAGAPPSHATTVSPPSISSTASIQSALSAPVVPASFPSPQTQMRNQNRTPMIRRANVSSLVFPQQEFQPAHISKKRERSSALKTQEKWMIGGWLIGLGVVLVGAALFALCPPLGAAAWGVGVKVAATVATGVIVAEEIAVGSLFGFLSITTVGASVAAGSFFGKLCSCFSTQEIPEQKPKPTIYIRPSLNHASYFPNTVPQHEKSRAPVDQSKSGSFFDKKKNNSRQLDKKRVASPPNVYIRESFRPGAVMS